MGKLVKLELENFKSYGGFHMVGPFKNFSCIVGPNGTGKSNLMDAISFVLGIQSRFLRSSNIKDLIFRKDNATALPRKAFVKLYYEVGDDSISHVNEKLLVFGRTITSSGSSTYQYQGKDVAFEEYESILNSIGVLVKIRNFLVFQGDVESIASKSPLELTKMIEHICGSDLLTPDYENFRKLKEEAEETTIFTLQKKKMFISQCKEVKAQKDEADYYQKRKKLLADTMEEYFLWLAWKTYSETQNKEDMIHGLRAQVKSIKEEQMQLEQDIVSVKQSSVKVNDQLRKSESDINSKTSVIDKTKTKDAELKSKLKSSNRRQAETEKKISHVSQDMQEQNIRCNRLQNQIEIISSNVENLRKEVQSFSEESLLLTAEQMTTYDELKGRVATETTTFRDKLLTLDLDRKDFQRELGTLEKQKENLIKDTEATNGLIGELNDRLKTLHDSVRSDKHSLEALKMERIEHTNLLSKIKAKQEEVQNAHFEVLEKLRNAGDDRRRGKHEQRTLEAINAMQTLFKGVYGKLVDLCRPIQKKYSQAITVAAGKLIDAVVVDTKATAADCIQYLKEQRIGVCTILPIDSIQSSSSSERMKNLGNQYKPCIDLVECNESVRIAVQYALDNTVVCDSLESAQHLCFVRGEPFKAVTLQGHVISRSGAMTGGSIRNTSDRWEDKEIDALRKRKVELEAELVGFSETNTIRAKVIEEEDKIRSMEAKVQYHEADIKVLTNRIAEFKNQLKMKTNRLKDIEQKLMECSAKLTENQTEVSELQNLLSFKESEIFEKFSLEVGIPNIRHYEESLSAKKSETLTNYNLKSKELASLKAQFDYEQHRDFPKLFDKLQSEIIKIKQDISILKSEEQGLQDQLLKQLHELEGARKSYDQTFAKKQELSNNLRTLLQQKSDIQQLLNSTDKKIGTEEMLIEKGNAELKSILQKATVEEVTLKLLNSQDAGTRIIVLFSTSSILVKFLFIL